MRWKLHNWLHGLSGGNCQVIFVSLVCAHNSHFATAASYRSSRQVQEESHCASWMLHRCERGSSRRPRACNSQPSIHQLFLSRA